MDENSLKILFKSEMDCLPLVGKVVRCLTSLLTMDEVLLYQIELSVHEALSNVVKHAYKAEAGHEIELEIVLEKGLIKFIIRDSGLKAPDKLAHRASMEPTTVERLPESGMGVYIMRKLMDEVTYEEENGKNITTLVKKFL